ncbi:class I SAM-dependent methyltransferase [Streptomyces cyaneofuscatus]|uniref:class I SAM-dependent methyltransferase n=1 Tax=Streptomyces cyaneofuscatus TaxID=66883 RepID=UPI0037A6D9D2
MRQEEREVHPSHHWVTERLAELYQDTPFELLDVGVMSGVTYEELRKASLPTAYTGIDIGQAIVQDCQAKHPEAAWHQMSVTDLAFSDARFDVVNCRHVLEHLPYYETAVREMFRVARRHVVLCFFQPPREPEALLRRESPNGYIWLNRYAPGPLEDLLDRLAETVEQVDIRHDHRLNRVYFCTKR